MASRLPAGLVLMLCFSLTACGWFQSGDPVEEIDVHSRSDAEKNLDAVRQMQADRTRSAAPPVDSGPASAPAN